MKKLDSEDWVGISQAYRFQTKGRASVKTHEEPSKFKTLKGGWIISSVKEREREREREIGGKQWPNHAEPGKPY